MNLSLLSRNRQHVIKVMQEFTVMLAYNCLLCDRPAFPRVIRSVTVTFNQQQQIDHQVAVVKLRDRCHNQSLEHLSHPYLSLISLHQHTVTKATDERIMGMTVCYEMSSRLLAFSVTTWQSHSSHTKERDTIAAVLRI